MCEVMSTPPFSLAIAAWCVYSPEVCFNSSEPVSRVEVTLKLELKSKFIF